MRVKRRLMKYSPLTKLELFLEDMVAQGLISDVMTFSNDLLMWAGKMHDANAPGIAARLRQMAADIIELADFEETLVLRLGQLFALIHHFRQLHKLKPAEGADLVRAIGYFYPLNFGWKEKRRRVKVVAGEWIVVGRYVELETLVSHTWLVGIRPSLQAIVRRKVKTAATSPLVTGARQRATLVYRANALPPYAHATCGKSLSPFHGTLPNLASVNEFLDDYAKAKQGRPWLDRFLCCVKAVTPIYTQGHGWYVRDAGGQASLPLSDAAHWTLLALSGGKPVDLVGEWDGIRLRPLGLSVDGLYHSLEDAPKDPEVKRLLTNSHSFIQAFITGIPRSAQALPYQSGNQVHDQMVNSMAVSPQIGLLVHALLFSALHRPLNPNLPAVPYVALAGVETQPACSLEAASLLADILRHHRWLLPEALERLRRSEQVFHPALLQMALDEQDVAVQGALLPFMGERGKWLSGINPNWSWVSKMPGSASQTAITPTPAQRARIESNILKRLDKGWISKSLCRQLCTLPAPWGSDLGESYVRALKKSSIEMVDDSYTGLQAWLDTIPVAVRSLPSGSYVQAGSSFPNPDPLKWKHEWRRRQWEGLLAQLRNAKIIRIRTRLLKAIPCF